MFAFDDVFILEPWDCITHFKLKEKKSLLYSPKGPKQEIFKHPQTLENKIWPRGELYANRKEWLSQMIQFR